MVNYILDLIHEDLNRITKKPYIEMKDDDGIRLDKDMADEFWNNFYARNQSIIVDLMYGQLKSTVTCIECKSSFRAFDPALTFLLPIARSVSLDVKFLRAERINSATG